MKSWGARLVKRLFISRSHNSDPVGDETPTVISPVEANPHQSNQRPNEELPIKGSAKGSDQIGLETSREAGLTKKNANAEIKVDKPHTLELPSNPVQLTNESTDKQPTLSTSLKPTQKPSQVGAPNSQRELRAGKGSMVGEGLAADETSERQRVLNNGTRDPDYDAKRRVISRLSTQKPSKANSKAPTSIEPENRAEVLASVKEASASQEPSNHVKLLQVKQGPAKNSPIPRAPVSPLKRSRKQKPKAADEQVTDEELAELEAENARLKLLLGERLRKN